MCRRTACCATRRRSRRSGRELTGASPISDRFPKPSVPLLDYIFVSGDIEAVRYEVLPDIFDGGYVSDHAPVMAVVKIAK